MTRRELLMAAGSAALFSSVANAAPVVPNPNGRRGVGAAPAGFGQRVRANRAATPPVDWIEYCHSLGFGAVETQVPPTTPEEIASMRDKIQTYDMHVIFNVRLPQNAADLPAYEAGIKAVQQVGGYGTHAAMTGRRYEVFNDFETFRKSFEQNKATIEMVEPILRKYKVKLAIENHKGWRSAEQAAWLKKLSSEYVGVHFDFGNNVSLCEDPMMTLDNLLPYTFSGHIKDMSVQPDPNGFLLSEVVLGDGFLDLKTMVDKLRKKNPEMPLDIETITREPLKIPVYTSRYWVTFDDSYSPLPGRDLARVLEIVQKNPPKKPVPATAGLSPAAQLKLEDDNNMASLIYARKNLGL